MGLGCRKRIRQRIKALPRSASRPDRERQGHDLGLAALAGGRQRPARPPGHRRFRQGRRAPRLALGEPLAQKTRLSGRTVRRCARHLEQLGEPRCVGGRRGVHGGRISNRCEVNMASSDQVDRSRGPTAGQPRQEPHGSALFGTVGDFAGAAKMTLRISAPPRIDASPRGELPALEAEPALRQGQPRRRAR